MDQRYKMLFIYIMWNGKCVQLAQNKHRIQLIIVILFQSTELWTKSISTQPNSNKRFLIQANESTQLTMKMFKFLQKAKEKRTFFFFFIKISIKSNWKLGEPASISIRAPLMTLQVFITLISLCKIWRRRMLMYHLKLR